MLETSAFQIFHGGNFTFINSFDKTKFLRNWAQGTVVRKPISRISTTFYFIFSTFGKSFFAYFCFSKLPSSYVKFCQISTLKNTLE